VTILLVEDNKDLADIIAQGLSGEIRIVDTLERAKAYIEMEPIHLVLLDLGLPDSHGIKTLETVREHGIPVVVLTANTELAHEAADMGVVDYIIKRDVRDILARIRFNINKLSKPKRTKPRFAPDTFEQIKAFLTYPTIELVHSH
jgi:DNA-binding response OmpR family regulator